MLVGVRRINCLRHRRVIDQESALDTFVRGCIREIDRIRHVLAIVDYKRQIWRAQIEETIFLLERVDSDFPRIREKTCCLVEFRKPKPKIF